MTAPRAGRPTTGQEVKMKPHDGMFLAVGPLDLILLPWADICGEDGVHDSSREDALQNISADDLLDSASQTARQHDSKFSFRSASYPAVDKLRLLTLSRLI